MAKQAKQQYPQHYRQGDLLLVRMDVSVDEDDLREDTTAQPDGVILRGETTGHAHRLLGGEVRVVDGSQAMYLVCLAAAQVVHEEHHTITLPRGVYRVVRQREYGPETIRTVVD